METVTSRDGTPIAYERNGEGPPLRRGCGGVHQVPLDEAVAKADPAADPAKDLSLDSPFQKVGRAWGKVASLSKAAMSSFLQQHEPPTIAQPQAQPHDQPTAP